MIRNKLIHRGPDAQKHVIRENSMFGHTRLAFQDLSESGTQPFVSHCDNYCLVFNGEIYNFKELRSVLEQCNVSFETNSDTEVLFKGLIEFGIEFISQLDGMFSFIFEDKNQDAVYAARDQHGIKPLFYQHNQNGIFLGSEQKLFENKITDQKSYIDYMIFGYIPEPQTFYKDIYCVPTDSIIKYNTIEKSLSFIPWSANKTKTYSLDKSVELSLISDVPVATFFSGGMDSSLLSFYSSASDDANYCFGLGFTDFHFDESKKQKDVSFALNFNSKTYFLSQSEIEDGITEFLNNLDYPTIDGLNTFLLSKKAKELGLKACLSGLGADELFGGYPTFFDHSKRQLWELAINVPERLLDFNLKTKRLKWLKYSDLLGKYLVRRALFSPDQVSEILSVPLSDVVHRLREHEVYINKNCYENLPSFLEKSYYMRGQLLKDTDYFSMLNSVEIRVPFLNLGISNWSKNVQNELYRQKFPKQILLDSQPEIFKELFYNIKKQGFILPFGNWLSRVNQFRRQKSDLRFSPIQQWSLSVLENV